MVAGKGKTSTVKKNPDKVLFSVYIDRETYNQLTKVAAKDRRAVSKMAEILIEQGINTRKEVQNI